jgi:hypothetical protein
MKTFCITSRGYESLAGKCFKSALKFGLSVALFDAVNGWQLSESKVEASDDLKLNAKKTKSPLFPAEIAGRFLWFNAYAFKSE